MASLYLTYAALTLLALAYARHHRHAFGAAPSSARVRTLRVVGSVLLCLCPVPWILQSGLAIGLTTWLWYALPCVAIVLIVFLALKPRWAARLALIGYFLAPRPN
jgi:hypothetical protein